MVHIPACFLVCVICVMLIPMVYAQSDNTQYVHERILGYHPITIALGIVVIGLALRLGMGIARKNSPFNIGHVFVSFVVGFFASLPIVATALHNIPQDITDLELFVMITGMVGTVMGVDAGVKSAGKKIMGKRKDDDTETRDEPNFGI